MGFKDPHDPREFRRFAQCAADGTVLAMIEVADSAPDPVDTADTLHVDVSALGRVDIDSEDVQAVLTPRLALARATLAKAPVDVG